jgi:hypothetical protein
MRGCIGYVQSPKRFLTQANVHHPFLITPRFARCVGFAHSKPFSKTYLKGGQGVTGGYSRTAKLSDLFLVAFQYNHL